MPVAAGFATGYALKAEFESEWYQALIKVGAGRGRAGATWWAWLLFENHPLTLFTSGC